MSDTMDINKVVTHFRDLQSRICDELEAADGKAFAQDVWQSDLGEGDSRVLEAGNIFEKAGVNFSYIAGDKLPPSAFSERNEFQGSPFKASGISIVLHPENPYLPTAHCNLRLFVIYPDGQDPQWWFGGGYDLTPYYPFKEDVVLWHQSAADACQDFGDDVYPEFKRWCDEYFYLAHRDETRGVGGLFFDNLKRWDFDKTFDFVRAVGDSFISAYAEILKRRKDTPFGERERQFQLYRRGRYVEFNLIYDRGTLFGLQSRGRVESILMSLPPLVQWKYRWQTQPDTPESQLCEEYLKPRDWLLKEK